jgi:chromosome segregation ATPase
MASCDICGKQFKNTQGLRGHRYFVHSDNGDNTRRPVAQQAGQQLLSSNSSTPAATEQRLSKLEDRFSILEHKIGARDTDEIEKIFGICSRPLNERAAQLTEQLSKLAEQLKSEYVSNEAMETVVTELAGEFESLHKEIVNTYNMSTAAICESRNTYKIGLSKIEGKLTTVSNEIHELSKNMKQVQESVRRNRASIDQQNTHLAFLESASPELKKKVDGIKFLASVPIRGD